MLLRNHGRKLKATGWRVCGLMVEASVKSVSKLIFSRAAVSFKHQMMKHRRSRSVCCFHPPIVLFFIWFAKAKAANHSDLPHSPDSSLSTANRLQQCRTWAAGKANADNADLQLGSAHQGLRPKTPSTSPTPTYVVINCRSARVTYIHISFPVLSWRFHGIPSRHCAATGWSCACLHIWQRMSIYVSID